MRSSSPNISSYSEFSFTTLHTTLVLTRPYSDSKHTGAFTYTPRITGAFPLQELVSSETYQSMREDLNKTLKEMTLTPLQKAQYTELQRWLDEGKLGLITPAMVPRGGMISSMEPNSAYISIIVFQGVSYFSISFILWDSYFNLAWILSWISCTSKTYLVYCLILNNVIAHQQYRSRSFAYYQPRIPFLEMG